MPACSKPRPRAPLAMLLIAASALIPALAQTPSPIADGKPLTLPATLEAGLFYLHPKPPDGRALRLFSDTGGGLLFTESGAKALGVTLDPNASREQPQRLSWPRFQADAWIPAPRGSERGVPLMQAPPDQTRHLGDGMLGANWFGGRSWQFDYPRGELRLLPANALPRVAAKHRVQLGFQKDADGQPTTHFPRIPVRIEGETLQLLFDTGASLRLSEQAARELDGGPNLRAGSFITSEVLKRWRQRHPQWRVVDKADADGRVRIIEVPQVQVGGYRVGPVWFAERPDKNFHEFMSQWMDRRVDGAIGGNAFSTLKISVDYPSGVAAFER